MTSDSAERLRIKRETSVTRTVMIVIAVYLICMVPKSYIAWSTSRSSCR